MNIQKKLGNLRGKTAFITGSSRGVGEAMALRFAKDGANVVIAAKTEVEAKLPGTIHSVAKKVEMLGGHALPLKVDVRFEYQVQNAVKETVNVFGGIDVLINNASALFLGEKATGKKMDLMSGVIIDGTRFCTEVCLPYLKKSANAHVINIAPPPNIAWHWFKEYGVYAAYKHAVSNLTVDMAEKFREFGIAFNSLWPKKMLYTAATRHIFGDEDARKHTRLPEIMADAAYLIATSDSRTCTGNFFTDEDLLRTDGMTDFSRYLLSGANEEDLYPDVFL